MTKSTLCKLMTFLFFIVGSVTYGQDKFSDPDVGDLQVNPGTGIPAAEDAVPNGDVMFYTGQAMFEEGCAGELVAEDFTSSRAIGLVACSGPFNSTTDDICYAPGDLVDGFGFDNVNAINDPSGVIPLPPGFFLPVWSVGPNFFTDNGRIDFTGSVNAVSFDLYDPFSPGGTFNIVVYGAGGVIGQMQYASNGATPVFVGLTADEDITAIEINDVTGLAQIIGNLSFGTCRAIPTLGEWGLIILALSFLIVGAVALRYRKPALQKA